MITRKILGLLLSGLVFFVSHCLTAQPVPVKWGKVTDKERDMTTCFIDSSASAVYLCTFGNLSFGSSTISITTHIRLKILTQEGKDYANVEIPFYTGNDLEKIINVKAQTINFDQDAKQVVQKVENDQIFTFEDENNWKMVRFTFPGAEVGSILEYQYTKVSKSFHFLEAWIFQEYEPVLHSEFRATFVQGLDYIVLMSGERLLKKYNNQNSIDSWVLNNLEPLRHEPYSYNRLDYAEMIRFQLKGYRKATDGYSSSHETFALTWVEMIKEIEALGVFNEMFTRPGRTAGIIKGLNLEGMDETEKVDILCQYIGDHFTWNGKYRIFPEQSLNQLLESHSGSSCELNMLLKLLLKEAGVETKALILSTREHGRISKLYPLMTQFNHLILFYHGGDKNVFIDATSPFRPYMLPDIQDLGQEGLVVDSGKEEWVMIDPEIRTRKDYLINLDLMQEDSARISFSSQSTGYFAAAERKNFKTSDEKNWMENYVFYGDLVLNELSVENLDKTGLPLKVMADISGTYGTTNSGFLYVQPFLATEFRDNPFKGETRFLPVELPNEHILHYVINISMPEDYHIAELPKNEFHELSNRWGSFTYQCKLISRNIQVVADVQINRRTFPKGYYRHLGEFYSIIAEKLNEMIVLKKVNL